MTTTTNPARVAFLILSDDLGRALPGLVMAPRMKANRGADVRVLFFGPGVKLVASGAADEQFDALRAAGIGAKACSANVEQYGLVEEIAARPVEFLAPGAEVEEYVRQGYTVLSF